MDLLKTVWGFSFKKRSKISELVIDAIILLVVGILAGVVMWVVGFLTGIPVLGAILALVLRIVGAIVDLYVLIGIVLMVLDYFHVFKNEQ